MLVDHYIQFSEMNGDELAENEVVNQLNIYMGLSRQGL
jgi:hypothetical protein